MASPYGAAASSAAASEGVSVATTNSGTNPALATQRVNLYFRAKNLLDADTFSKSDPYLLLHDVTNGGRVFMGKTETIWNDLNPQWKTSIGVNYHFEMHQEFHYTIYDDDGKGTAGDDLLAKGTFVLAKVVSGRQSTLQLQLVPKGTLWIHSEEASMLARDTVAIHFQGHKLKNLETFGTSDPYFKLFRLLPGGTRKLLCQSKAASSTLDPDWAATPPIKVADLVVGEDWRTRCLVLEVWDENVFSDDFMGEVHLCLQEVMDAANRSSTNPSHPQLLQLVKPKKEGKLYGDIIVKSATMKHFPSFMEFLSAGLQINVAVSIDFTGSNGQQSDPRSLHYNGDPRQPNQYVQAITSVCDVLLDYDSDKMVPVFGFGAQLPTGEISHCFHLNGQADPHVHALDGVLKAYHDALRVIKFSGPTNFAPTVLKATAAANASVGAYTILLIITDGCITDTDATIDAIVAAGASPLSIIIVGVGNADFETMDVLDGDEERLRDRFGRPALRDLVQFVPFRDFRSAVKSALAAEVLREVPDQVVEWATINHVTPQHFGSATAK